LNTEPDRNFTWWNTTTGSDISFLVYPITITTSVIPDKDWMPYRYVEYEPKWHKKFARYKLQISKMWD